MMLQVGRLGRWGGGRGCHLVKKLAHGEVLVEPGPQMWEGWRAREEEVGSHPRPKSLRLLVIGARWEPVTDGNCVGMRVRGASFGRLE